MEISRNTGIAHTSTKKNLKVLVKQGIITVEHQKKGVRNFPTYRANLPNKTYKTYKSISNLQFFNDSGLVEYIEERLAPRSIVLFGSYSRGEDTETSDVDLFVECKMEAIDLAAFEKKLKRKIQLHFSDHFASYPKELKNNIINGIVLSGYLEGFK